MKNISSRLLREKVCSDASGDVQTDPPFTHEDGC